jgi:hypothetical protein
MNGADPAVLAMLQAEETPWLVNEAPGIEAVT